MGTSLVGRRRRFFVERTRHFDTHEYNIKRITAAVRAAGGMNIRLSHSHGWPHLPKVVCFTVPEKTVDAVRESVANALRLPWITVSDKWW